MLVDGTTHNQMKRITSESTVEEVMAELGVGEEEELRESSKRQNTLEKFSQMRSRNPKVTLSLEETPTAFVKVDEELDEFIDITVTTKRFEQSVTDLPPKYSDYLIQKAMTSHEVGHVLYSDWPALEHFMDKVKEDELDHEGVDESMADSYKQMFQNFANVLEDGAIEKFLTEEFRLDEEIVHLRATLHEKEAVYVDDRDCYFGQLYPVETDGDGKLIEKEYHYPFFYAVMTAALNLGVYDNGELDKLLDENNDTHIFAIRGGEVDREMFIQDVLPMLRSYVSKIHNETDAWQRMEKIYELWCEVRKYIDRSQTSGRTEFEQRQKQQSSNSYIEGVPENLSDAHGEQDSEPIVIVDGDGSEEESGNSQTHGEKQGDRVEISEENGGVGSAKKKAKEGIIQESKQESGDWSDEIEEIINSLAAGEGTDEIAIADDGTVNQSRLQESKNLSRKTARLFERRLKQLNKDKVLRNKERGKFDSRALIPAERGSTRAFKKTKKGEEKNYSCMIVLDRSGSMRNDIEDVELAAGAVAWGLEENGVDTCILDTESSMTTLSKPFGTTTDSFKQKVFAGRCGGGTPLQHTVDFARQRMKRGEGEYPFMIIITDGGVHGKKEFKNHVNDANFPVLGFYIGTSKGTVEDQLTLYDRAVVCDSDENVSKKLMNLINSIIF